MPLPKTSLRFAFLAGTVANVSAFAVVSCSDDATSTNDASATPGILPHERRKRPSAR